MARTTAVGDEPVVFFTDSGQHLFLPLSDIEFDGAVPQSKTHTSASLGNWLKYLVAQGRLAAGPTPALPDAIVFEAPDEGSTGNNILVKVAANTPTSVYITVTETDLYEGLTLDPASDFYLPKIIGASGVAPSTKSRLGLVRVKTIDPGAPDPAEGPAQPVAGTIPSWTIAGAGGATDPSFTLEARAAGSEAGGWVIEVSDVKQAGGARATFTLEVTWTKTVILAEADLTILPSEPASPLFPLAFAVTIKRPAGASALKLPRPGSVTLQGGAENAPATTATATLSASA